MRTKLVRFVCIPVAAAAAAAAASPSELPLRFEPNQGQIAGEAQFLSRGHGYHAALSGAGAEFDGGGGTVRFALQGARPGVRGRGEQPLPGTANYFRGDRSQWRTNIPTFGRVRFNGVYDGIDLVYYGRGRELEYDFVVHPGASHEVIAFRFDAASGARIDSAGDLVLTTKSGEARQRKPYIYQEIGGIRRPVAGGYRIHPDGAIGFSVGPYDRGHDLVIDPVLQFATFYGGTIRESAHSVAVDGNGDIYVAGLATSPNFPATAGAHQGRVVGGNDVFVVKLNATGTQVIYSALVGGGDDETLGNITVDRDFNVFLCGTTRSVNFPTTAGVVQERPTGAAGDSDGYVTKLNRFGTQLVYSTRLGGKLPDSAFGVAVDATGAAFVTGDTLSTDFPVTLEMFQSERKGYNDAFVTKLRPDGSGIIWSTFLGGDNDSFVVAIDSGRHIAVDRASQVWVAGITSLRDFPTTTNAPQREHLGQADVFVSKFSADGKALLFSTFLGGEGADNVNGMYLDPSGTNLYLVGDTNSLRFPASPGVFQGFLFGGGPAENRDGFVVRLNASGQLLYSTFLGGNGDDQLNGVTADEQGNAFVIGTTSSRDLQTTFDAIQKNISGGPTGEPYDAFLFYLDPLGAFARFGTYLGGPRNDNGNAIARDAAGNLYLAGYTQSAGFPLTPGALQSTTGFGTSTAFIARVGEARPGPASLSIVSGDNQSADEGTAVRQPLVVALRDMFRNPIPGQVISFTATNATLSAPTATTDRNGQAFVLATLNPRPGTATVVARFGDLPPVTFTLTSLRVGPPLPEITDGSIISAGQSTPPLRYLSPNARGILSGKNFTIGGADRTVDDSNPPDGQLPGSLANTCLTIGGIPARLLSVTPFQILFQVPDNVALGNQPVVVISNCGIIGELRSDPRTVEIRASSPEFFYYQQNPDGANPVQAINLETGAGVGPVGAGGAFATSPARPNDVVRIFGSGFGRTNPPIGVGQVTPGFLPTVEQPAVLFDNEQLPAENVLGAGLTPGFAGIYHLDIRVPDNARNGRLPIVVRFGLNSSSPGAFLAVTGGQDRDPRLAVSPSRIDFGDVIVGQFREAPITVGNAGTSRLTIQAFNTGNAQVTLSPNFGFSLAPGETRVLTLRFTPNSVFALSTNLSIATDDPVQPLLRVPITGNAINQPPAPNPVPVISGISPFTIDAGGAAFNLVVNGSGFVRGSTVEVNGQPRSTFFNHPGQLIAFIQALDILDPGVLRISVNNPAPGGGRSNEASLVVQGVATQNQPLALINQFDLRFCPLVTSFVTVLDSGGNPVRNLQRDNATCREDGQVVDCTVTPAAADTPASVSIVFGMNGLAAIEDELLLKAAVRSFVNALPPQDRISIVHLEDQARPLLPFTQDKDLVLNLIDQLRPVGPGNAVYDAVVHSTTSMRFETNRRKIVVLFTALDNLSGALQDFNQALGTARASGATVYTIALGQGVSNVNLGGFLRQLSRDTGGQYFSETSALQYSGLFGRLVQIINSQYAVQTYAQQIDGRNKALSFTFRIPEGTVTATRNYTPCNP